MWLSQDMAFLYQHVLYDIYGIVKTRLIAMKMNSREQLIYELLFGEKQDFSINVSSYVDSERDTNDFMHEMRYVLQRGGVKIVSDYTTREANSKIWKLKVQH